jgi:hypothetical protein
LITKSWKFYPQCSCHAGIDVAQSIRYRRCHLFKRPKAHADMEPIENVSCRL